MKSAAAPSPICSKCSAHHGWSQATGSTACGIPARHTAATVPAPPWCTAPQQKGSSQSWGTADSWKTFCSANLMKMDEKTLESGRKWMEHINISTNLGKLGGKMKVRWQWMEMMGARNQKTCGIWCLCVWKWNSDKPWDFGVHYSQRQKHESPTKAMYVWTETGPGDLPMDVNGARTAKNRTLAGHLIFVYVCVVVCVCACEGSWKWMGRRGGNQKNIEWNKNRGYSVCEWI